MCRATNTCTVHLHHMEWCDDCLGVYFAHMKNDQCGEKKRDPRHIYANSIDPVVCPIIALGAYLSTHNITGIKDSRLFPGSNQYFRFSKCLNDILKKYEVDIKKHFGVEVQNIGVHSIRKGASSYVSGGSTCAPPQVATNIRAGWTMGGVQDTYLRYEAAGDQYVGRVVSGLPISSPKFAALPPQFDCCVKTADKIVQLFFPGLPNTLYCAGKYFAASIIYSLETLRQHLHPSNPLLTAIFCTSSHLKTYEKYTYQKFAWSYDDLEEENASQEPSTASIPERIPPITKATGIPSHVLLLADMQRVINSQQGLMKKIEIVIKNEFDQREVGHSSLLLQQEMKSMIENFEAKVINEISTLKLSNYSGQVESADSSLMSQLQSTGCNGGRWYHWKNKFRRVPSDWSFPQMTLRNAFHRYFLPDTKNQVCPFKFFQSCDVANIKNGRRILSSLNTLMKFMIDELKKKNKFHNDPTEEQVDTMYRECSGYVFSITSSHRAESFSWRTHYKNLDAHNRKNKN